MPIPNSNLTEILATTLAKFYPTGSLADNVTQSNMLLWMLSKKGNILEFDGGTQINLPLEYAEGNFQRFSGADTWSTAAADVITGATASWMQAVSTIVVDGRSERINMGSETQVVNFVTSKIKNGTNTIKNNIADDLYSDGSATNQIGGLQYLVPDDPTTSSSILGINQNTQSWWRSKLVDISTEGVSLSSTTIRQVMSLAFLRASRGDDRPDLVIAGDTYFTFYENGLQDLQRFMDSKAAEAGFETLRFKRALVYPDTRTALSATRMYFLNTDYLKLAVHTDANFKIGKPRVPTNQDATLWPIMFMGNLICTNRSLQCVIIA